MADTQQTMRLFERGKIGFAVFTGSITSKLCYRENIPRLTGMAQKFIVDLRRVIDVADPVDFRSCFVDLRGGGKRVVLCGDDVTVNAMLQLHELDEPFETCPDPDIAELLIKEQQVALVA